MLCTYMLMVYHHIDNETSEITEMGRTTLEENHGSINEEKVNHIAERITEAINYVTGKLR